MHEDQTELDTDIRNIRGRLLRIGAATLFAAVFTTVMLLGMYDVTGSPNDGPVGGSMVWLVAISTFVLTAYFGARAIDAVVRIRRQRESTSLRASGRTPR